MQTEINEVEINGVNYVRKDSISTPHVIKENAVIIRTRSAGVFFGYKTSNRESLEKGIVDLVQARRIWYWSGAASISQLAINGTSNPKDCKFPEAVPTITLTEVLEVIPCSEQAVKSIEAVKIWKL